MSGRRFGELAWVRERVGPHKVMNILYCGKCPQRIDVTQQSDVPPLTTTRHFREKGWHIEKHTQAKSVRCPRCQMQNGYRPPTQEPDAMEQPAEKPPTNVATLPLRKLTPDERTRVRDMLDSEFDIEGGCYRRGMSGQEVGRKTNVPWALVQQLREIAYGEIKGDPEILEVGKTIIALESRMTKAMEWLGDIEKDINAAKAKIETVKKRFAS